MGKCNLLKPLNSNNGNFFMFSQYSEDLTIEYTQKDTSRVVPSKFIALDLNVTGLNDKKLAEIFQNYYENHCCYWRAQENYDKNCSFDLLLQTLEKYNLISVKDNTSTNIKYIGDINIYSNKEVDGMTYNEIYCYIPNEAKETRYKLSKEDQKLVKQSEDTIPTYIMGFSESDLLSSGVYYNNLSLTAENAGEKFELYNNDIIDFSEHAIIDTKSFSVNTIIVLYDIKNKLDNITTYYNLPMGIYFTGKIENDIINNPITKYVSNSEIYDQGTSYGLRICTRYLSQININTLQETVSIETYDSTETITKLLSEMNESQQLMQETLNQSVQNINNLKEHYNLFKTSKTNIPYIKNVAGEHYWFVNGKNTDVKVFDETQLIINIDSITDNQLNTTIDNYLLNGSDVIQQNTNNYLEYNQLNKLAKSINSEFLHKLDGVNKQELNNFATLDYVNKTFVTADNIVTKDFIENDYLTKEDATKIYIPLSVQSSFITIDKLNSKADKAHTHKVTDIEGLNTTTLSNIVYINGDNVEEFSDLLEKQILDLQIKYIIPLGYTINNSTKITLIPSFNILDGQYTDVYNKLLTNQNITVNDTLYLQLTLTKILHPNNIEPVIFVDNITKYGIPTGYEIMPDMEL